MGLECVATGGFASANPPAEAIPVAPPAAAKNFRRFISARSFHPGLRYSMTRLVFFRDTPHLDEKISARNHVIEVNPGDGAALSSGTILNPVFAVGSRPEKFALSFV
jgi:hypothetical protein